MGNVTSNNSQIVATYQDFVSSCAPAAEDVYTKRLSQMKLPVSQCGGKAFNLSFLLSTDRIRVPDGLCVLTNAYMRHIDTCIGRLTMLADSSSFKEAWDVILALPVDEQKNVLSELAEQVKIQPLDKATKAAVSGWLAQQARDIVKSFAVRSSATDEDSGNNSFAGQYLTMLNQSSAEVMLALRHVWASAFTFHSVTYRLKRNLLTPPILGVVLMPQLNSMISGVLFTQSPMALCPDHMLLEATFGQGEGVVSGEVGVDRWTLSKNEKRVLHVKTSPKEAKYVLEHQKSGLKLLGNDAADVERACLNDSQLQDVINAGILVEGVYGSPQDIEFSFADDNRLYIIQSRPITTIVKPKVDISDVEVPPGNWEIERTHYAGAIAPVMEEVLAYPNTRMFRDCFQRFGSGLDFIDITFIKGFAYTQPRPVGAPVKTGPTKLPPKPIMHLLFKLHPELRRRVEVASRTFEDKKYMEEWKHWDEVKRPEMIAKHAALIQELEGMEKLSIDGYLQLLQKAMDHAKHSMNMHHYATVPCLLPTGDLLAHAPKWGMTATDVFGLICGFGRPCGVLGMPENVREWMRLVAADEAAARLLFSEEMEARDLVAQLKKWPGAIGRFLCDTLAVTQYRLVHSYECTQPTLMEQPNMILADLRLAAQGKMLMSEEEVKRQQHARMEVRKRIASEEDRLMFDERLREAETLAPLRDERHLWCDGIGTGILRHVLLEGGRRAKAFGHVDQPEDLMELKHDKIVAYFRGESELSAEQLSQSKAWRAAHTWADMPNWIGAPPTGPPPLDYFPERVRRTEAAMQAAMGNLFNHHNGGSLRGDSLEGIAGGSAKTVEGTVRVIKCTKDMCTVGAGDVVVACNTSAAFNSVLAVCGAVITEGGGLLSHAAVTAREMDKVAVVAVMKATSILKSGDRVRVNGKTGQIVRVQN